MQRDNGLSDFAETLVTALKKMGYRNIPKFENLRELKQRYKNFSSMEMAKKYAEEHDLEKSTVLFKMLKQIENQEPFNIAETAKALGIRDRLLSYAINNFSELEAVGTARSKKFYYTSKDPLTMKTAEHLLSLINNMKSAKLRQADKDKLDDYIKAGKSYVDFRKENSLKKDRVYVAENYFNAKKSQLKLQDKKKKVVTEAKFNVPKKHEAENNGNVQHLDIVKEVKPVQEVEQVRVAEPTAAVVENKKEQLQGEQLLNDVLKKQMVFFEQKIKYLETKMKGQEEFIAYLIEQLKIENQ